MHANGFNYMCSFLIFPLQSKHKPFRVHSCTPVLVRLFAGLQIIYALGMVLHLYIAVSYRALYILLNVKLNIQDIQTMRHFVNPWP